MECYDSNSLYHVFARVIKSHYKRIHSLLEEIGLYPGQHPMLFILGHKGGQSQKELAEKLKIKPATITVMITRMEKVGLVERKQDTEDQRISRVYLTEKGKEIFSLVKEKLEEINEECFKNFTEEEKVLLRRLFLQMLENLDEANNEAKPGNSEPIIDK
jgi:DNA-binding MarR family transcriptional regulator